MPGKVNLNRLFTNPNEMTVSFHYSSYFGGVCITWKKMFAN